MTAWFYILRLQSGSLYIGATKNLEKRHAEHRVGSAGRTTSLDPPVSLVYSEEHESFSKARQREAQEIENIFDGTGINPNPKERTKDSKVTEIKLKALIEKIRNKNGICIACHINEKNGLREEIKKLKRVEY